MKKLWCWIYGGIFLLALIVWFCFASLPDSQLHIFVLDIGQGDAILIRTPADEFILIDGGPDSKVIQQLGRVMPFYERTIDAIIVSHPHADHVNGLVDVIKRYQVQQVMMTGVKSSSPGYTAFLQQIAEQKIPVIFTGGTKDYQIGGLILDILYPFESLQGRSFENLNNSSITFRLLFGERSFYFSGDLEMEKEKELVASPLNLRADFLKAGHHGSRTSNTEPLLDRIQPEYAAISCGVENKFHHPYPTTIQHFQQRHIEIYRTDLDGLIEVVSDGKNLNVRAWEK